MVSLSSFFVSMAILNTMFKEKANTMFNNAVFSCAIIPRMEKDNEMSPQMQRLYHAAKTLKGWSGKSFIARQLGVLPQAMTNWHAGRPISYEALVTAQEKIGCDAIWLRDGTGDMVRGNGTIASAVSVEELARLVTYYVQSDEDGRESIMSMAESTEKFAPTGVIVKPANKSQ